MEAVRHLAMRQHRTCGEVVSDLLRKALMPELGGEKRSGITLFPKRSDSTFVTPELFNRLRDEV